MHKNIKISEGLAVLASIDPASIAASTVTSAWVPVTNFLSFLLVVQTGVLGAAATVDAKIQQATDVSGTGAKDLSPGKSITQIVKATGDNKQALLDFRAQDLDAANGFSYVRVSLTVAAAASIVGALLYGGSARFMPPRDPTANPAINLGASTVLSIS